MNDLSVGNLFQNGQSLPFSEKDSPKLKNSDSSNFSVLFYHFLEGGGNPSINKSEMTQNNQEKKQKSNGSPFACMADLTFKTSARVSLNKLKIDSKVFVNGLQQNDIKESPFIKVKLKSEKKNLVKALFGLSKKNTASTKNILTKQIKPTDQLKVQIKNGDSKVEIIKDNNLFKLAGNHNVLKKPQGNILKVDEKFNAKPFQLIKSKNGQEPVNIKNNILNHNEQNVIVSKKAQIVNGLNKQLSKPLPKNEFSLKNVARNDGFQGITKGSKIPHNVLFNKKTNIELSPKHFEKNNKELISQNRDSQKVEIGNGKSINNPKLFENVISRIKEKFGKKLVTKNTSDKVIKVSEKLVKNKKLSNMNSKNNTLSNQNNVQAVSHKLSDSVDNRFTKLSDLIFTKDGSKNEMISDNNTIKKNAQILENKVRFRLFNLKKPGSENNTDAVEKFVKKMSSSYQEGKIAELFKGDLKKGLEFQQVLKGLMRGIAEARAKKPLNRAIIDLDPPSLGKIEVKLTYFSDSRVDVHVRSDNSAVKEMLENSFGSMSFTGGEKGRESSGDRRHDHYYGNTSEELDVSLIESAFEKIQDSFDEEQAINVVV